MEHTLKDTAEKFDTWKIRADQDVEKWILMSSPKDPMIVMAIYLLFVVFVGPAVMRNRKPFELKAIIVLYNGAQVFFSVFLITAALKAGVPFRDFFASTCKHKVEETPESKLRVTSALWWYLVAKVTEFLDTVFFVLRKKYNQVSFLHVYHHALTFLITWCLLNYAPDEQTMFIIVVNSFIHVFMYFYYMLSSMGPKYQKYLWWKKYMTSMQIIQFFMVIGYLILAKLSNCGYSKVMSNVLLGNTLVLLILFSNFYIKSYSKKRS